MSDNTIQTQSPGALSLLGKDILKRRRVVKSVFELKKLLNTCVTILASVDADKAPYQRYEYMAINAVLEKAYDYIEQIIEVVPSTVYSAEAYIVRPNLEKLQIKSQVKSPVKPQVKSPVK